MRQARVQDHWRHVYTKPYSRYIESFSYSNIAGVGSGKIIFRGGISAICGGNGVGKSTLLDAIACTTISPDYAVNHIGHQRFVGAVFAADMEIDNVGVTRMMSFSNGGFEITGDLDCEITHLNPATLALSVTAFLRRTTNFAEVLESLEPKVATVYELQQLSYIVGKRYESVETYEIEDYSLEGNDDTPSDHSEANITFPYFRVVSDGVGYSSETMGLGELSLFILVWTLNRISENSILLIEEPETYISPSSQKKFMDFMARVSDIKGIWIILTTHSPSIVENIQLNRITLLTRDKTGVTVIDTPSQFQLDEVLDKSHSYSGILLVEDAVAQIFLRALLSKLASDIHRRYEVLIAEDESSLSQVKNCFPRRSEWFEMAVVYDGDQREKQVDGNIPHGFLPRASSPESLLQQTAIHNLQRLSAIIDRPVDDMKVVLGAIEGRDTHDWLVELSERLAIPKEALIDILVGICLDSNEEARNEAMELIALIRNSFKNLP